MKTSSIIIIMFFVGIQANGQEQKSYSTSNNTNYLVHFPKNYANSKNGVPLLLFLHGLDEKGNDIELVKRHGPPHLIQKGDWPEEHPFLVVSPQLPSRYHYWPEKFVEEIVQHVLNNYNVDERRIYLTGISLGGIGTWNYAVHYPEKLAAIIPICGKGEPKLACNMDNLPVWAFHGEDDQVVFPGGSIRMINALNNCSNRDKINTRFTLYPGVKHDSWTITYQNPEIYSWLLQQTKDTLNEQDSVLSPKSKIKEENLGNLQTVCRLPVAVNETSGLAFFNSGFLWTHNDSNNLPVIFQIDTTGKVNDYKTVTNAANFDWEDLATDEMGNLYIGDFGNNKNNRKTLQIYFVPNPNNIKQDRVKAEVITFAYSDQKAFPPAPENMNYDMEAMIVFNQNIYLFSKNNTNPYSGYVKLYKLPVTPGEHIAELVDSLFLGDTNMLDNSITGADISPNKKNIVLLTYSKIWLLNNFEEDNFFKGAIIPIQLPTLSQKEGITFKNNTEVFISDERFKNILGGNLYLLNLSPYILD